MKEPTLIKQIEDDVRKAEVISFDIFDTLLLRPYAKPQDLFWHIEKAYSRVGFCEERRAAEHRARLRHKELEDITYDMIYEEIDDKFKDLKQTETDWEKMVLRANPEMKKVYEYAKEQGKRIVIASDMYLPGVFIAEVLNQNGYDGWDKLYVSGDINKCKGRGTLYSQILQDMQIKPCDLLHIGDNKNSDYLKPKELGINTILYDKVYERFLRDYNGRPIKADTLGLSVLTAVLSMEALRDDRYSDFWKKIGSVYGGIACFTYMKWLQEQVVKDKIKDILFVARDGYVLKKVFDTFNTGIKTHYIYAPRFLNLICTLDHKNDLEKLNMILKYYNQKGKIRGYKHFKHFGGAIKCFSRNYEQILEQSGEELRAYKKFLQKDGRFGKNIGVVDSYSWNFSALKLIQNTMPYKNVCGYFMQTSVDYTLKYQSLYDVDVKTQGIFKYWSFMELIMTSPEPPILTVCNNEVVYKKKLSKYETDRSKIYDSICAGILDFANDMNDIFGKYGQVFLVEDLQNWINLLIDYPTDEEKRQFSKIRHASDLKHCKYEHLFPFWYEGAKISIREKISYMIKRIYNKLWS